MIGDDFADSKVTVKKAVLLSAISGNRVKHCEEFADDWNRRRPNMPARVTDEGLVRVVMFEGNLDPAVVAKAAEAAGGRLVARHAPGSELE